MAKKRRYENHKVACPKCGDLLQTTYVKEGLDYERHSHCPNVDCSYKKGKKKEAGDAPMSPLQL